MKKQKFENNRQCILIDEDDKFIAFVRINSFDEKEKLYEISKIDLVFEIERDKVSSKADLEVPKKVQEAFLCDYNEFQDF